MPLAIQKNRKTLQSLEPPSLFVTHKTVRLQYAKLTRITVVNTGALFHECVYDLRLVIF